MKNQKGFSLVEALLVLILVGLLGFTGYYVYNSKHSADSTYAKTQKVSGGSVMSGIDPITGWTSFSSTGGQFSLKYPSKWVKASGNGCVEDAVLLLGPTQETAGHCASEATPEIFVTSITSDSRPDYEYKNTEYPDLKKETVMINGVQGDKISGTLRTSQQTFTGSPNGTKSIEYVFYTNGRTYVATYNQVPSAPDVSAQFNLMMTKTFQFHS